MNVAQLVSPFDGQRLVTLDLGGRPGWRAQHVGDLLGYAGRGRRLVKKIRSEWMAEFLHGHDYLRLEDELVLLKPGLDLVLSRTCKDVGKRLRRHIIDQVLPAFEVVEQPVVVPGESTSPLVMRERRLRDKLELEDRRFRSASLHHAARILRDLGRLTDEEFVLCEVAAVEIALGGQIPQALPVGGA